MRFNPKARLDTGRVGDSGSGGGGMGGGGMRIPIPGGTRAGGGIGGLIIIILFIVISSCLGGGGLPSPDSGIDPQGQGGGDTSRMEDSERYANCKTGADANKDVDCARVAVENSLVAYWAEQLPAQGGPEFTPANMRTFSGGVATGCGQATSQVGPFYCPADQKIYLDTTFFADVLEGQLGGQGGDFVEPYVLAHEYGHHIQNLLGTMGQVRTQQGPESDAVRLELQADCYAGLWAHHAQEVRQKLEAGDIEEALTAASAIGDDRMQRRTQGQVVPESFTHGTSQQRMTWFRRGFDKGTLESCDTFGS